MKKFWNNNKDQSWFVIVWLILFFPVGLYLMFRHSEWGKIPKTIVTVGLAVIVFGVGGNTEDTDTSIASEDDTVTEEVEASEESDSDEVEEEPKEPEPQGEVANENDDSVEETEESGEAATEEESDDEETTAKDVEESEEKQSVEEKGTEEDESIEHEVIDGVDIFTYTDESIFSFNKQMTDFSMEMTELLSERHEEIKGDVIFRTISTVQDDKGNEKTIYTSQAYYSQETVNSINYDNWPQSVGEDLYNTADGVMVYHHLSNDTDIENKSPANEPPEIYYTTIGADYEE